MNPDAAGNAPPDADAAPAAAEPTVCRVAKICNKLGLHARAARRIVVTASQFAAEIWVRKNGTKVPATDILELLLLEAPQGTVVELSASGPQAEAAVEALVRLIECKFDED
jgi:phosphotransferase system HPr (HPr) family protein